MSTLTSKEQDALVAIFSGKGFSNNFEVLSTENNNFLALNTVAFNEIPAEIFSKLNIENQTSLDGKYTSSMLLDEEYCCGFHIYWDKEISADSKDVLSIGMYAEGGGDLPFDFVLEDILDKEHFDTLHSFGFNQIQTVIDMEDVER